MSVELIAKIRDAEAEAERIIGDARSIAGKNIEEAGMKAKRKLDDARKQCASLLRESIEKAGKEEEEEVKKMEEEEKKKSSRLMEIAEKKFDQAVIVIVERL